ncbi:MAG: hypothetical protein WKF55_06060 [Gemmatimonadaceae bacterium]
MRRFLSRVIALAAAIVISGILISRYDAHAADDNYLAAVLEKDRLIRSTPSPKLILVGGSNLAFGIDSRMLQDSLGLRVVNMGLYAKLGLRYMLAQARPYIGKGDLVIVVPEYEQFFGEFGNGDFTLNTALLYAPLDRIGDFSQSYSVIDVVLRPRVENTRRSFLKGLAQLTGQGQAYQPQDTNSYYSRQAFDSLGDMVAHLGRSGLHPDSIYVKEIPPMREFNAEMVDELNVVAGVARKRGARAYFLFPAYIDRSYEVSRPRIDSLRARLESDMHLPIVGKASDFVLPAPLFFDTRYHLNQEGRRLRTLRMIQLLRPYALREVSAVRTSSSCAVAACG